MPLRQSLLISIVLIIVFTLLFGSAIMYWHAVNKVDTEMTAAMAVGGRIARNAVDDVEESSNPKRRLELLVADFDGDRHLKAMVVDAVGQPKLESKPAEPDSPAPSWFRALLVPEQKWLNVKMPDAFSGLGTFILEPQPYNEIAEAWDDTKKTLLILSVLCVLTMVLVYRVLGQALSPLQDLADAVSKIGKTKSAPKINERGPSEFVTVYRGFNQMVDRLTETERTNAALNEQLNTVQEEERSALARDLHDEVGPFLFSVDVDAKSIEQLAGETNAGPESITNRTQRIRDSVAHMQKHLRDILGRLRSPEMLDMGLEHAIESLLSFWRRRQPKIKFSYSAVTATFGDKVDPVFYRVAQESISNAVRHGKPSEIVIRIWQPKPNVAGLEIIDNGSGLGDGSEFRTYGISGMNERVELIGGKLSVDDRVDVSGVRVVALVPVHQDACDSIVDRKERQVERS